MNKCPRCGKENERKFCPDCGTEMKLIDTTDSYSEKILREYNSVAHNQVTVGCGNVITKWLLKNMKNLKVVGAVLCFVGIIMNLMTRIVLILPMGYYASGWSTLGGLALIAGLAFLAMLCLSNANRIFLYVALSCVIVATVCECIALIQNVSYEYCSVMVLICAIVSALISLFYLITVSRELYQYIESYSVVFLILPIILFLISLISCGASYSSYYYYCFGGYNGGLYFLTWISVLLSLYIPVIVFPLAVILYNNTDKVEANTENKIYNNASGNSELDGYHGIALLIMLCIFTLGIYNYVWIYRTAKLLNSKLNKSESATAQLLLCMFIPFYIIYWVYKTCKNIEECSYKLNNRDDNISVIGMILTLFGLFLIAAALMQDQVNKIVKVDSGCYNNENNAYSSNTNSRGNANSYFYHAVDEPKELIGAVLEPVNSNINDQGINEDARSNQTGKAVMKKSSIAEELKEYKDLVDAGLITEEEFTAIKKKILGI